jgi:Na+-translocating ferredoxin:NAD+ oxidoreductase RNF subunit RnfB
MKAPKKTLEDPGRAGGVLLALKEDRCVGCTHCLRVCPTEAIRIRGGKARMMPHRCIDCGECIRVCPRKAWAVETKPWERVREKGKIVAVLDPAVFGQFGNRVFPGMILRAFSEIGISKVEDMGQGLAYYRRAVAGHLASGRAASPAISSDCPAVVQLVQVKFPSLLENLVPVIPPFEILADLLRKRTEWRPTGGDLCYVVPCLAKARAATEVGNPGRSYHHAIPFNEVFPILRAQLHGREEEPFPEADRPPSVPALEWAYPGGQSRALGLEASLTVDGASQVADVLELAENGLLEEVPFIEAWSCRGGCLGGPLNVRNPFWARFQLFSRTRKEEARSPETPDRGEDVNAYIMDQPFPPRPGMRLDENLQVAVEKLRRIDEVVKQFPGIDCGSCGSPSCLALAEDVVQGYARETDCICNLQKGKTVEAGRRKEASRGRPPKSRRKRR